MNDRVGGHACIEEGKKSGKFYQFSIKGWASIPSSVNLFDGSRTNNFVIKALALSET